MKDEKAIAVVDTTPQSDALATVFGGATETPARAQPLADRLRAVVEQCSLSISLDGRPHVRVEGWLALGAMLGLAVREASIVEHDNGSWYEATVEVVHLRDGRVISRASAECGRGERHWHVRRVFDKKARQWVEREVPAYARRSMAITRAAGKALRLTLGWIVPLAGYAATPAEEVEDIADILSREPELAPARRGAQQPHKPHKPHQPEQRGFSAEYRAKIVRRIRELERTLHEGGIHVDPLPEGDLDNADLDELIAHGQQLKNMLESRTL